MLYPKGALASLLDANPAHQATVFAALGRLTRTQFTDEGRVYGGGLHKMEPKELERVSAEPLLAALPILDSEATALFHYTRVAL